MKWLWERLGGDPYSRVWRNALGIAAGNRNLEVMEWLFDMNCHVDAFFFSSTAVDLHIDALEFMWNRNEIDIATIELWYNMALSNYAVASDYTSILKWLIDHGLPLPPVAFSSCASRGQLDALRFLRSHHCPWDASSLREAVKHGHLDILQWALSNGCPWTAKDRWECLGLCPRHRIGMRRWIMECWPEEPPPPLD